MAHAHAPSPFDPLEAFPILPSRVDRKSKEFQENLRANLASIERLQKALAQAHGGGGPKAIERHRQAGKLLPRERLELLLDEGSYFLEIAPLAGFEVPGHAPGAGVIGGIGLVSGVECVIT
ncbi:MAG: acyl-CoA carboxylase subunit beta, partial [Sandaracinaceae bacterium]|nr:acyl-CoA carboxylase subunit beta [Sandaracinaceae bacterium]